MTRAAHLFLLSLAHALHRLRHDLAREIVVAICALILGGLFYYVFSDFLNTEVANLSQAMRQKFGDALAYALLVSTAVGCGRHIRAEWDDERSFAAMAAFLGESPTTIALLGWMRLPSLLLLYFAPAWYVSLHTLADWSAPRASLVLCGTLALTALVSMAKGRPTKSRALRPLLAKETYPPLPAMVVWRAKQMALRNRPCQIALFFALALASLVGIFTARAAPPLVPVLVAYLAGMMPACALALQVSYDLPYAWIERNLGVSDRQYLRVLEILGLGFALGTGLTVCLAALAGSLMHGSPVEVGGLVTLAAIAATPPFLVPYLVFQVDGRRVGIQLITLILSSLFLATAVYASLFSLALLPFVAYYGVQSQAGRFYRA